MFKDWKIGAKLMAAFTLVSVIMLIIGAYSIFSQNSTHELVALILARESKITEAVDTARSAQVNFKKQVQEWKNILLRGARDNLYAQYFKAFND